MLDVIILCGGKGLRMSEITSTIPKPLAIVRGRPIIWHIMNHYSRFGYNNFILPLGYKGAAIKEYFRETKVYSHKSEYMVETEAIDNEQKNEKKWCITFVDTGEETMTGARVKMLEKYIKDDEFLLTYGDGIADVDIKALVDYHEKMGKMVTVTGINYKSNYGILTVEEGIAVRFNEKPRLDLIINGGFFVCNKEVFSYLSEDVGCILENTLLEQMANKKELAVYKHNGYWIGIDTCKDIEEANLLLEDKEN